MRFFLLLPILTTVLITVNCVSLEDLIKTEWEEFKVIHNKTYENENEDRFRFKVFLENRAKIARHNRDASNSMRSYRLSMNKYGDLLHHEFVKLNGYRSINTRIENGSSYLSPAHVKVPDSIDWRQHGLVTPVKDQKQCGSCWAFSTTGALEGQIKRKTGKLISLSEQNLVDCSTRFGNNGCNGGLMDNGFTYIKRNHGIDTEKSYPYEAKDGKCRFAKSHVGATDTGFVDIPTGDEERLKEAIGTVGPVSVAIDASHQSFQFYSGGVYDEPTCSSTELDHGVLAVGYGTSDDGQDYWLIKNSWSKNWGEDGYIKIARNKENLCGVATQASYPLV